MDSKGKDSRVFRDEKWKCELALLADTLNLQLQGCDSMITGMNDAVKGFSSEAASYGRHRCTSATCLISPVECCNVEPICCNDFPKGALSFHGPLEALKRIKGVSSCSATHLLSTWKTYLYTDSDGAGRAAV